MQGMFYGAFQGRKRDIRALLSKLGEARDAYDIKGIIFCDVELPDNWEEMDEKEWVKIQFSSHGSMRTNYLEGGLFSDLGAYMLYVEGFTCTISMNYYRTYTYSPYGSLEILSTNSKKKAQEISQEFEQETGCQSVTRDKQDWDDSHNSNAEQFIANEVLPPAIKQEGTSFLIKKGVLMQYTGSDAEEVIIPDSCTRIGPRAFQEHEEIKRVVIPGSVKSIGESAFYGCKSLEQAELSVGLESIERSAFFGTALSNLYLPDGLKEISRFSMDKVKLRIPASLKSLHEGEYDSPLEYLTGIEVAENHPVYACHDGILYRHKDGVLLRCFKEIEGVFEVPAGVKKIADKAFSGQRNLTHIRIPDGVEIIGEDAFGGCWALETVELPEGLTEIGRDAFMYCEALSAVQLPASLKKIEWCAFENCKSLKRLELPDGLTEIGFHAFRHCEALSSVRLSASLKKIGSSAFGDCKSLKYLELPDGLEGESSFVNDWDGLLSADLSAPVVRGLLRTHPVELHLTPGRDYTGLVTQAALEVLIEQDDVENFALAEPFTPELCDWLPDLLRHAQSCGATKMEAHLKELEQAELASGKKHKPLTAAQWKKLWTLSDNKDGTYTAKKYKGEFSHAILPEMVGKHKVVKVEMNSKWTGSIKTLTIPASVTDLYFDSALKVLERIEVSEDNQKYSSHDGVLFNKAGKILLWCPPGRQGSITIPAGVTKIGEDAFCGCSSLTSIIIPKRVTKIGDRAFDDCSGLTSITIPDGVTEIGGWAFWYCTSLTSITIPDGVTKIGRSAFYNCDKLTSITIPESVTEIGESAFDNCSSLTSIIIPAGVTKISRSAFSQCYRLTNISIPESVTEIGESAFSQCYRLTSITIPEGVTKIGKGAFYGCHSLTSIIIPESVTEIGESTFDACSRLTNITIPEGVTEIGRCAFFNCSNLTSITIPDSVTEIGEYAFSGCSLTSITIPESVTEIGDYAFRNCNNLTIHTPAGSYAEQYAKEHNIPYVND